MPSNHLIFCRPLLLLLQSFPASGSFPVSQLFTSGGQSIGASASTSVPLMNSSGLISFRIDWLDLLYTIPYHTNYPSQDTVKQATEGQNTTKSSFFIMVNQQVMLKTEISFKLQHECDLWDMKVNTKKISKRTESDWLWRKGNGCGRQEWTVCIFGSWNNMRT